jgi:hypothetical protein
MFNSPVIDLVILLSFTYFTGSLIISAINEAISGALRQRQKLLKQSIEGLFFEDAWRKFVKDTLIKSPHIQSLMRIEDRYPAYIPSKNFIMAVLQQLGPEFPKDMQKHIENSNLPPDFKQVLKDFVVDANNNFELFKHNIETFFNNSMERAAGWYKKKIRRVLLVIGIFLAIVLNIDTIRIVNDALRDKKQLEATTNRIAEFLPRVTSDSSSVITIRDADQNIVFKQEIGVSMDSANLDLKKTGSIKALTLEYENITGYHLGYKGLDGFMKEWFGVRPIGIRQENFTDRVIRFLSKFLGVLITAFALQISANYWFDLMNKAVNIRAVGKRPNGKKEDHN